MIDQQIRFAKLLTFMRTRNGDTSHSRRFCSLDLFVFARPEVLLDSFADRIVERWVGGAARYASA